MGGPLEGVRFRAYEVADSEGDDLEPPALRSGYAFRALIAPAMFSTDEAAARHYLSHVLEHDRRPAMRGLSAPNRPELMPDLKLKAVLNSPLTGSQIVNFEQLNHSIPVFGAHASVELGPGRKLIGIDAELGTVEQVSPLATLTPGQALGKVAEAADAAAGSFTVDDAPQLYFYRKDDGDRWHLAYFAKNVPLAPPALAAAARGSRWHGGPSPRTLRPRLNYLVDAHDGEILLYYSAAPMITQCRGTDELGVTHKFWGEASGAVFELADSLRRVKTFDLRIKDVGSPLPPTAALNESADWEAVNTAAISAHVNAGRVYDFFRGVLMRYGVDDKGMELSSVVNCTLSDEESPPDWHNAVWWQGRMWYGQVKDAQGRLNSWARYLDVIAHELTHGITEYSSNLVYLNQAGALNESFSDIFGVIVNNWYTVGPDSDVAGWSWEIGSGLGAAGGPLRDLSAPARTADPDHMNTYVETKEDFGGVHTNSSIHNKAAHNVLRARDVGGKRIFASRDAAVLYYLTLVRLTPFADFKKALQVLVDVSNEYFLGAPDRNEKLAAIRAAYAAVGIAL